MQYLKQLWEGGWKGVAKYLCVTAIDKVKLKEAMEGVQINQSVSALNLTIYKDLMTAFFFQDIISTLTRAS